MINRSDILGDASTFAKLTSSRSTSSRLVKISIKLIIQLTPLDAILIRRSVKCQKVTQLPSAHSFVSLSDDEI